ncbi:hypothetical protein CHLRE_04g220461v5 [Chlamydomonas reinhardtii]|uniref:Uncharacterized protein n=1 Tax=Chlamydomonas reinhardtii TaxID=3055 RepID=A0A2K3DU74_CHLRE|nr:uncharacterized protein CHLRE_04g220461v5 [Chlamydomonas reinhardtii]PNW84088.1 hypothetical protein CHLRE_04g220461v5 [Chlamydomonas reinhardtii]
MPTQEAAKWAGWAWLMQHAEAAELRYILLPDDWTPDQVLAAERSFLDTFDFPLNGSYRLNVADFWGGLGIPAMPDELKRWVAEQWWYAGLDHLTELLTEH